MKFDNYQSYLDYRIKSSDLENEKTIMSYFNKNRYNNIKNLNSSYNLSYDETIKYLNPLNIEKFNKEELKIQSLPTLSLLIIHQKYNIGLNGLEDKIVKYHIDGKTKLTYKTIDDPNDNQDDTLAVSSDIKANNGTTLEEFAEIYGTTVENFVIYLGTIKAKDLVK